MEIIQYNLKGEKLNIFKSINEASKKTGISYNLIYNNLKKKNKTANRKSIFIYKNDIPPKGENTIQLYSLSGQLLNEFNDVNEASDFIKVKKSHINDSLRTGRIINKKYIFLRKKDVKNFKFKFIKIYCFDLKGKLLNIYDNYYEASEKLNISYKKIYQNLKKEIKKVNNKYIFVYENEKNLVKDLIKNVKQNCSRGEIELKRFANKLNTNVVGGASKLLKHFIRNYSPKKIITYADLRYSNGNLYEKLGFKKTIYSEPGYFYVIKNKRKNRFNFTKFKLIQDGFDPNKTEHEIMKERGIYRIYNSGNQKYELII